MYNNVKYIFFFYLLLYSTIISNVNVHYYSLLNYFLIFKYFDFVKEF